jgi:hypothetical protein
MNQTIGYVYSLNHPNTGNAKYVGATKDPEKRLRQHKRGETNEKVRDWVNGLSDKGLEPNMEVHYKGEIGTLGEAELDVANELAQKYDLLNEPTTPRYNHSQPKPETKSKVVVGGDNNNRTGVKVEIDPDDIQKRPTDDRGRVYLGSEYANSNVEVVVLDYE